MHQLVTQWDTLSSEKRGGLAGYAVGKHGADILAPGALAKVASKSVKSAQELAAVCKNFQRAQEILVLETAAEIGSGIKIAEVLEAGQKTAFLAEELGFTASEAGQPKQAGVLETTVNHQYRLIKKDPIKGASIELFERAEKELRQHKGFIPETAAKELLHKNGIPTFSRPANIPESFRVKFSNNGAGIKYIHPENEQTYVRVMPGKPHAKYPHQQKPYVVQMKDGKTLDNTGKIVAADALEAHIPLDEFVCRDYLLK